MLAAVMRPFNTDGGLRFQKKIVPWADFSRLGDDFLLIEPPRSIGLEDAADLIAHPAKDLHLLFFSARGMSRVIKTPMVAIHLSWKHRASLIGVTADGNHRFDRLRQEFIEML